MPYILPVFIMKNIYHGSSSSGTTRIEKVDIEKSKKKMHQHWRQFNGCKRKKIKNDANSFHWQWIRQWIQLAIFICDWNLTKKVQNATRSWHFWNVINTCSKHRFILISFLFVLLFNLSSSMNLIWQNSYCPIIWIRRIFCWLVILSQCIHEWLRTKFNLIQ